MQDRKIRLGLICAWVLLFVGCQPQIGDDCVRDLDCSRTSERSCDTTQLGGYCTQMGCTPTSCPESEGVCVSFNNSRSSVSACMDPGRSSPYARNFCMKTCDEDSDCRVGYDCVDMSESNPWGASVIQKDASGTRVCIAPQSAQPIGPDRKTEVCSASGAAGASSLGGAPPL